MNGTKALKNCLEITSLKNCLYHFNTKSILSQLPYFNLGAYSNLCIGIYYVFLKEWLGVFPQENVFIINFTDYRKNVTEVFNHLLEFLNLEPYDESARSHFQQWIDQGKVINKAKTEPSEMLPETRMLLNDLYQRYNVLLYDLLNESGYNWSSGFQ